MPSYIHTMNKESQERALTSTMPDAHDLEFHDTAPHVVSFRLGTSRFVALFSPVYEFYITDIIPVQSAHHYITLLSTPPKTYRHTSINGVKEGSVFCLGKVNNTVIHHNAAFAMIDTIAGASMAQGRLVKATLLFDGGLIPGQEVFETFSTPIKQDKGGLLMRISPNRYSPSEIYRPWTSKPLFFL